LLVKEKWAIVLTPTDGVCYRLALDDWANAGNSSVLLVALPGPD